MGYLRWHFHLIWDALPPVLVMYAISFGGNVAGLLYETPKIFSLVLLALTVPFAFRHTSRLPGMLSLILLVIVMCLSMVISPSFLGAWLVLLWVGIAITLWISQAIPVEQLERAVTAVITTMALIAFYDLIEWWFQNGFLAGAPIRPSSTLSNPNVVAPVMMIGIALALYTKRMLWLAAFAVVMTFTGSRATFLAMVVGTSTMAVFQSPQLHLTRKHILMGTAVVVVLLPLLILQTEHPTHAPTDTRVDLWRVAAITFTQHPLVGIGPERYRVAFLELAQMVHNTNHIHAHNIYLQVAAETGALGLIALGALILSTASRIWRAFRSGHKYGAGIAAALMAGLLAHGMLDYVYWVLALVLMISWVGRILLTTRPMPASDFPDHRNWRHTVTAGLAVLGYPAILLAHNIDRQMGWLYVSATGMAFLLSCAFYITIPATLQSVEPVTGERGKIAQPANTEQIPSLLS